MVPTAPGSSKEYEMKLFGKEIPLRPNVARSDGSHQSEHTSPRMVPPGQVATQKWPVLTAGSTPRVDLSTCTLRFTGLVENPMVLTHQELLALPRKRMSAEFHCVTGWSRLDNEWEGVGFKELIGRVHPKPEARYVMALCHGGYTTNLTLEALLEEDTLLAFRHNGEDLTPEHGWPLRLLVPKRYSWKSAKWVRGFDFMEEDEPGFWEIRGYHNDGDPWKEERFSP